MACLFDRYTVFEKSITRELSLCVVGRPEGGEVLAVAEKRLAKRRVKAQATGSRRTRLDIYDVRANLLARSRDKGPNAGRLGGS